MIRRLAFVVPACLALVCASACSDPAPPARRVILTATFGPGNHTGTECPIAQTDWVDIGSFGNPPLVPVRPVQAGGDNGNGPVDVICSVKGNDAAGYDVAASATLSGLSGGTVSITGHFTTTGDQPNINGVFQRQDYGQFREADCTVTFTQNPNMGIAPGRVWGYLTCPNAARADQGRVCDAEAEIRFENCDQ
jgi:hypothetical protein